MSRQYVEMQTAYKEELEEIENAFLTERGDLLTANRKEMQVGTWESRGQCQPSFSRGGAQGHEGRCPPAMWR